MLIKAYIKKHLFHLPTLDNQKLETQVEQELNIKVDKSQIFKLYPLTKIEDNENILVEKQRTNIFLLNLLLLVLNHNKKGIIAQEYYNNEFIISKLEKETNLKLENIPFEDLEKDIMEYVNSSRDKDNMSKSKVESNDKTESKNDSIFENVEFSLNWLSKAQKELNHIQEKLKQKEVKSKKN
ncbi:hypothetical protein [Bacillus toyonensis]|uniref:hypothetical protein n=1 Tax=Bacillus toyonensis TaxID=155322 RepID=UPI000BF22559|nr:hypothetical protein [Bacillus toyonensis]PEK79357.1 hypothetical protein CN594_25415 [Bacillus toyonensis]PFY41152.1 hypothetical protein COL55_23690 [Bacillus toyonensis]PFY81318.1 hypothetical protein COL62_10900 [Bacillus toyonensis]PGD19422.1 hypothetical protein COM37_20305 [Bacillus toyonensis]PHA46482.1 hypothetical protein COE68_05620 [Bacillus toyonensis]